MFVICVIVDDTTLYILWFIAIETLEFGETFYKVAASLTTMQTTNKDFVQI
jgi:hypothetical protein